MNKKALSKIGWIIKTMKQEAAKRKAPVNQIKNIVRSDPYRSLVFTILSSRTKDENTIVAAGNLLKVAPNPNKLASMQTKRIEKQIRSAGFYRVKAKNLKAMAKMLIQDFDGIVPKTRDQLIKLPGVGRKTANVVLVYAFGKSEIPVDVHVHRISNRLGLLKTKTPEKTEIALAKIIPKRFWKQLNHAFVSYGQTICLPRNPKCDMCKIRKICWRIGVRR